MISDHTDVYLVSASDQVPCRHWRHDDNNNNMSISKCSHSTCSVPGALLSTLTALGVSSRGKQTLEQSRKCGSRYMLCALSGGAQAELSLKRCVGLTRGSWGAGCCRQRGCRAQGLQGIGRAEEQSTAEGTWEEANVLWGSWALVTRNCHHISVAC